MLNISLRLITHRDLTDYESIKLLKDWRKKNQFAYVGNYKVTHKSIKKWLKESVLDNPDRFLFWVIVDGRKIGHIGVKNIRKNSIEVDNVARGVEGHKGAMSNALKQIVNMYSGYRIWLRVLPNNFHAIAFYINNDFKTYKYGEDFDYMVYAK